MLILSFSVSLFFLLFDFLNRILNLYYSKWVFAGCLSSFYLLFHKLGLEFTKSYQTFQRFDLGSSPVPFPFHLDILVSVASYGMDISYIYSSLLYSSIILVSVLIIIALAIFKCIFAMKVTIFWMCL